MDKCFSWMAAVRERQAGSVRCSVSNAVNLPLVGQLATFGLQLHDDRLLQVDASRAQRVLAVLLRRGFVGDAETMRPDRALEIAASFVADAGGETATYFTNGNWDDDELRHGWTPLTDAVFDGGLIACGPSIAACMWIEEED
jgi:hypothetical protein